MQILARRIGTCEPKPRELSKHGTNPGRAPNHGAIRSPIMPCAALPNHGAYKLPTLPLLQSQKSLNETSTILHPSHKLTQTLVQLLRQCEDMLKGSNTTQTNLLSSWPQMGYIIGTTLVPPSIRKYPAAHWRPFVLHSC